jgi:aspartyl-tRNA(Asn)/glutamyl-tRNA(Gln) amidotransferase subunit B
VFKAIVLTPQSPLEYAKEHQLIQNSNEEELTSWIHTVLNNHPDKVDAYKKGKKGLIGVFIGEVKKISQGKADPQKTTQLLETILSK